MMDPRLDPDTLFWVFEPDFRFFPPGQNPERWQSHSGFLPVEELTAYTAQQTAEPTAGNKGRKGGKGKGGKGGKGKGEKPEGQR